MIIGPYYVIGYEVNHKLIISYTSQSNLIRVFYLLSIFLGFVFDISVQGKAACFKNNVLIKYFIPEIHPEKERLQLNRYKVSKIYSGQIRKGKEKRK